MNTTQNFDTFVSIYRCHAHHLQEHRLSASKPIATNEQCATVLHYIKHGHCIISGENFEHKAEAGDILILPRGASHTLTHWKIDNNAISSTLISGRFHIEESNNNPLLQHLPNVIVMNNHEQKKYRGLVPLLNIMVDEVNRSELGSQSIINRCAEAVLIYLLRTWHTNEELPAGVFSAFNDPKLSKALSAFHQRFSHQWSLQELAHEAGMSRSAFANLFRDTTGITPIAYITQWRMQWAATQIRNKHGKIADIATLSGYRSEVSFSRAFKAHFGFSPSVLKHKLNAA